MNSDEAKAEVDRAIVAWCMDWYRKANRESWPEGPRIILQLQPLYELCQERERWE